ncbi:hypothetical protein Ac2012v2_004340 [Leucoagaricus gongylophorus]
MNPAQPETFNHRCELLSTGRNYHFVDQLPNGYNPKLNTTILCVHGFPDFWYGWRYQIGPWVREGYRVVVPDMLGYGETDKPEDIGNYTTKQLCADLVAILDLIGVHKIVIIGHDWGSYIVGRFALWYPDRLTALIMLSVPYIPPSPVYTPIQEVARKAPNLEYQVYFASQGSTTNIEANLRTFLRLCFHPPESLLDISKGEFWSKPLSQLTLEAENSVLLPQELDYYVQVLSKGMNGPLNYYRTTKRRHEEELAAGLPSNLRPDLPVLFIWGTKDVTATPAAIRNAGKFVPRLQDITLEERGHWIMVEAKDEVTRRISDWLKGLGEYSKGRL